MKLKKIRTVEIKTETDIVPFVSLKKYPTSVFVSSVLNFSLPPVREGKFRNSSLCVDLGT